MITKTNAVKLGVLAASAIAITGCATNQGYMTSDTGRALEEAYAKQIVDPTPAQGAPSVTPDVAAAAIQRYIDGEVKDPSPPDTAIVLTGE